MTEQQYNSIKDFIHLSSFYPQQIETMFQAFISVEGWNPGCKTCPANVTFVKGRLQARCSEYLAKIEQEKEQQQLLKTKQEEEQQEIELKNSEKAAKKKNIK